MRQKAINLARSTQSHGRYSHHGETDGSDLRRHWDHPLWENGKFLSPDATPGLTLRTSQKLNPNLAPKPKPKSIPTNRRQNKKNPPFLNPKTGTNTFTPNTRPPLISGTKLQARYGRELKPGTSPYRSRARIQGSEEQL